MLGQTNEVPDSNGHFSLEGFFNPGAIYRHSSSARTELELSIMHHCHPAVQRGQGVGGG